MTSNQKRFGLALAVLCQLLIIVGLFAHASYPLWVGKEVRVETIPVDPRSLFRGNYAELNYEFTRLPANVFDSDARPNRGEPVYVTLKQGADGLYKLDKASLEEPTGEDVVYLRGEALHRYEPVMVDFGIDAYFAPKEKALRLESDLRHGGVTVLKVASNGRAAIEEIVPNPKPRDVESLQEEWQRLGQTF